MVRATDKSIILSDCRTIHLMAWKPKFRYIVTIDGTKKFFLGVKEDTETGDLQIYPRGRRRQSRLIEGKEPLIDISTSGEITGDSITIHCNPQSSIQTIALNRKRNIDGQPQEKAVAYFLDVRDGFRIVPIYASVGRNLTATNLTLGSRRPESAEDIELWPGQSISSDSNSVAYLIGVANPKIEFQIPDDFPRNSQMLLSSHLRLIFFYWAFNQPMRYSGTSLAFPTTDQRNPPPVLGLELHELLNLTNDLTLQHAQRYRSYPTLPSTE